MTLLLEAAQAVTQSGVELPTLGELANIGAVLFLVRTMHADIRSLREEVVELRVAMAEQFASSRERDEELREELEAKDGTGEEPALEVVNHG